jgi:hypothetical protein
MQVKYEIKNNDDLKNAQNANLIVNETDEVQDFLKRVDNKHATSFVWY